MKIICVDNYDREHISDRLVCENINQFMGQKIVNFLNNENRGGYDPEFYRLVADDYKLYTFEP